MIVVSKVQSNKLQNGSSLDQDIKQRYFFTVIFYMQVVPIMKIWKYGDFKKAFLPIDTFQTNPCKGY